MQWSTARILYADFMIDIYYHNFVQSQMLEAQEMRFRGRFKAGPMHRGTTIYGKLDMTSQIIN